MPDLGYAAIMFAAVATTAALLKRNQRSLPLTPEQRVALGLGAFCGAMLGAKLPFVWGDAAAVLSGAAWFTNGKTILLGLVGGYLGVELAKWATGVRQKTGDSFAAPVAAGVAVGRLACFYAGCCYGLPTRLPWGVAFPTAGPEPRHPTQLYEAAFHALAAVALYRLQARGAWRGQLIKAYLLAYLAFRFVTEWIRPEERFWLGLTGYQLACVALAGLFAWLWRRDSLAAPAAGDPPPGVPNAGGAG